MLKKIYQELVLIRTELRAIKISKEFCYKITMDRKEAANTVKSYVGEDGTIKLDTITSNNFKYDVIKYPMFDQVEVRFQLPYHGWKILEKSHFWKPALEYLSEIQRRGR